MAPIKIRPYRGSQKVLEVDISVTMPSGEKVRERKKSPVTSKSGTQRWAEAREREILLHGLLPKNKKLAPTLLAFRTPYLDYCRAERRKESYIQLQESVLRAWLIPQLGSKRLNQIDNGEITVLKEALGKKSRNHANNVLLCLRRLLKAAVTLKQLDDLGCEIVLYKTSPKERPFFEFGDYEILVQAAGEMDPRTHLVVLLGAEAGLRIGETVALEQSDVDYRRGYVLIQRAEYRGHIGTPKGGKSRRVPMTSRLKAALRAHRHLKCDRVLCSNDGSLITYKMIVTMLAKAEKRAGLAECKGNTHKLRHTFCSHLAMRGAPARSIQELAGHRDLKTTLNYMHLSPTATQSAIALLESHGEILETGSEGGAKH